MRFVDEASITITAGKGGDGCLGFRREKFIPNGGPDGGDGGNGGSIYFVAIDGLNTLIDFRHKRKFHAQNGAAGQGSLCSGKAGEDLVIEVPQGTQIFNAETEELMADLTDYNIPVLLAKGGFHGFGNAYFKSSTNQAPRRVTKGYPGQAFSLRLELKVLADVGLLGIPNAGKSSLIRAVSAAKPKVADYPFTTLYPSLGVVKVSEGRSFVMADIPGLIEGASEGTGLGIAFLKHLFRTTVLLHVVDSFAIDGTDPIHNIQTILHELQAYNEEFLKKPQWLVLNKMDLLSAEERKKLLAPVKKELKWKAPIYCVSTLTSEGLDTLKQDLMKEIEKKNSH